MQIIKNRQIVDNDWQHLADDAAIMAGNITVSLTRWLAEREVLLARTDDVGVRLLGEEDFTILAPDLSQLALVVINFPAFTDGRGYSVARLLRERYGYTGELRAQGDILHDQLFYLSQMGFDSFELAQPEQLPHALTAFDDFSESYQTTVLRPEPLYRRK